MSKEPTERYIKGELLSSNDYYVKYCAFDQKEGLNVLWYEFNIRTPSTMNNDLKSKIKKLSTIHHPNVINLFHSWMDQTRHIYNFVTEYFTNQTLSSYAQTIGSNITRSAIGKWVAQIIDALDVFHKCSPPFVHGNIRCDNIFIDPSNGIVKIGLPDFDVFYNSETKAIQSPEAQKFVYVPKNDVWSLGMAVLELATLKKPFSNDSDVQSREKLSSGCLPPEFLEISDPVIADFILTCILPLEQRPSVSQLRDHPLFADIEPDDESANHSMSNDILSREISPEIQKMPEFISLLQKQSQERKELLYKHELQRNELKKKIKKRLQSQGKI